MCAETRSAEIGAAQNAHSKALQERAERFFPGGVNSPVRAFRAVGGSPPFIERAEGAYLYDADGNRYIDYFGSWGPMILGHAFPPVVEAIERAARNSASFGASTAAEADLAERIAACYPAIEKMRFVSSGTEATMSAIRVARAATGRDVIVKFEGCYHGHADGLLVKAGSGVATFGIPGSAGVPEEVARLTVALPYNNLDAVEAAFAAHADSIAAVIIEPIVGNAGCIVPEPGYLAGLRALTASHGALLIVDEVMTGFRVALGGACQLYSLDPDLVTLGKIVGGGLPVGVFGGKLRFMDFWRRWGRFIRRELSAAIRWPWLPALRPLVICRSTRLKFTRALKRQPKPLPRALRRRLRRASIPLTTNRVGSMWTWFFNSGPINDYEQAAKSDTAAFGRFHRAMLDRGIWLPPSQFEAAFVSTAHGEGEVRATIAAAREAFASLGAS